MISTVKYRVILFSPKRDIYNDYTLSVRVIGDNGDTDEEEVYNATTTYLGYELSLSMVSIGFLLCEND